MAIYYSGLLQRQSVYKSLWKLRQKQREINMAEIQMPADSLIAGVLKATAIAQCLLILGDIWRFQAREVGDSARYL